VSGGAPDQRRYASRSRRASSGSGPTGTTSSSDTGSPSPARWHTASKPASLVAIEVHLDDIELHADGSAGEQESAVVLERVRPVPHLTALSWRQPTT